MNSLTGPSEILIAAAVLCAVTSSLFFVFTYRGWMRALRQLRVRPSAANEQRAQKPGVSVPAVSVPAVSVVIAAHDEEANIAALMDALCAQDYASDLYEVILVDDRSKDRTADIALSYLDRLNLRVLRIEETPPGVSPKKFALHEGISAAAQEIVLLTDADCVPRSGWIAGMVEAFSQPADAVIGLAPLTVRGRRTAAAEYAMFESRRTAALAIAAAAAGLPYMASGRSWAFTRTMYTRCGGLPALYEHLGGDDDLLLQRMVASGAKVGTCTRQDAIVESAALESWSALFRQKQRHYRVSSAYRGRAAFLLAIFVLTELLTPLLVIALSFVLTGPARLLPLVFWLWKLWYDTGFLMYAFKWMSGETSRLPLVFSEGMHIFFSALTGFTSFVKPPRW